MTNKRIVCVRADGAVSVIIPAPEYIAKLMRGGLTEDQAIEQVQQKDLPPDATEAHVCDCKDLPSDRTFRDAWSCSSGDVSVDMEAARAIQDNRIKDACLAKARDLLEREAIGEDVAAEKARLRNVNMKNRIAAAKTPQELKTVWPDAL